ncbi:MAG TPA: hypothetical protein VIK89_12180 [Cytophagaceae bacterium]
MIEDIWRYSALQCCDIFLEEVFEFFLGEHGVDEFEYGLPVFIVELLEEA